MYINTSKLHLPSTILFQQLLPKLGSWTYYTLQFSFAVKTMVTNANSCVAAQAAVQCCLSAAKGNENKELHFEEIAKGKCSCTIGPVLVSHHENHRLESFCPSLHLNNHHLPTRDKSPENKVHKYYFCCFQ